MGLVAQDICIPSLARQTIQGVMRGGWLVAGWALGIGDGCRGLIPWVLGGEKVVITVYSLQYRLACVLNSQRWKFLEQCKRNRYVQSL